MPPSKFRDDITVIGVPLTEICNREYTDPRQRQLFKNIIYLGVLSALLDIDVAAIETLIGEQFSGKDKLIKPNINALHLGRDWALAELDCPIGLRLEARRQGRRPHLRQRQRRRRARRRLWRRDGLPRGIRSRPSSSLAEAFAAHCRRFRVDAETGKSTASPSSRPRTSSPRSAW